MGIGSIASWSCFPVSEDLYFYQLAGRAKRIHPKSIQSAGRHGICSTSAGPNFGCHDLIKSPVKTERVRNERDLPRSTDIHFTRRCEATRPSEALRIQTENPAEPSGAAAAKPSAAASSAAGHSPPSAAGSWALGGVTAPEGEDSPKATDCEGSNMPALPLK